MICVEGIMICLEEIMICVDWKIEDGISIATVKTTCAVNVSLTVVLGAVEDGVRTFAMRTGMRLMIATGDVPRLVGSFNIAVTTIACKE